MVTQVSCKLTNALIAYGERQGISLISLFELFDGPEEFLRDPHFWLEISQCERIFTKAARLTGDPGLGATVGAQITDLQAFGALDNVFKMMPSKSDYYNNLAKFFTYFLAPVSDFREMEHGEQHVRFRFPIDGGEFPHVFGFLRAVLENLPRYTAHPAAQSEYDPEKNELLINWATQQESLFDEEPGQVLNPKLIQTLSAQLEASERALHAKNREVMALQAELDQIRFELQSQMREKIYAEKMTGLAQLAAGVAHEINNPLSFVVSNLGRFEDYFQRLKNYVIYLEKFVAGAAVGSRAPDEGRSGSRLSSGGLNDGLSGGFGFEGRSGVGDENKNMNRNRDGSWSRDESSAGTGNSNATSAGQAPRALALSDLRAHLDVDFIFSETPTMLKEAGEGLKRVKEIVKDLSSLAHPQGAGRIENKISADLNGILESSLKVFESQLGDRIQVEKKLDLKEPVKVFPVRISQVFMNLLSNAIHAIRGQGRIEIKTIQKDGRAVIEIADSGVGMDDTVLARIFTPFFTTKEVGKGTGLGLSIARSIVEMHEGRIDVKSEKGKGSRFTVSLPMKGADHA